MNMNDCPKVTIAIPTINRSKYLTEAIESCLSQTYQDFEIVISDNKSDDDTEKVVRSFTDPRIKYFQHAQRVPMVDNWNKCVELASAEFITFLCDDDILTNHYLANLVTLLMSNNKAALARSAYRFVDESLHNIGEVVDKYGFPIEETPENLVFEALNGRRTLPLDGFICRTELLRAINGFVDVGFPNGLYSDHYAWFRIAFHGEVILATDEVLWLYRKHGANAVDTYKRSTFIANISHYMDLIDQLPIGTLYQSELECAKKKFAENLQGLGNKRQLWIYTPENLKTILNAMKNKFRSK